MKTIKMIMMLTLLGLVACGSDSGGSGSGSESKKENKSVAQEMVEASPGTYYSVLRPVNFHSNGFIPYGMATFILKEDELQVSISMDDDQAVSHRQSLHLGTRCPTSTDDNNGDGFVDYEEALKVVGPALMPLDNDINSQLAGMEVFPKGPGMTYSKVASLAKINSDLWKVDEDSSDNLMKLSRDKGIGFENRVVLVHGTSFQSSFPSSLASHNGENANISLPVVCGVLNKID